MILSDTCVTETTTKRTVTSKSSTTELTSPMVPQSPVCTPNNEEELGSGIAGISPVVKTNEDISAAAVTLRNVSSNLVLIQDSAKSTSDFIRQDNGTWVKKEV